MLKLYLMLALLSFLAYSLWVPKILWTYWNVPFSNTSYLNLYLKNHQKYAQGWQVRHLNDENVETYVQKIPSYNGQLNRFYFELAAHKADYIRVLIINFYGGVWIDFSTILTQKLDWLDENLLINNPDVRNIFGKQPNFLSFTHPHYGSKRKYFSEQRNYSYQISPGYEVWFFASKANSKFMNEWFLYYQRAYLSTKNINTHDAKTNFIDKIMQQEQIQVGYMGHYLLLGQIEQVIVQMRQKQLDQLEGHLLAVNQYGLWHLQSEQGPFGFGVNLVYHQVYFLIKYPISIFKNFNFKSKYFYKLISTARSRSSQCLRKVIKYKDFDTALSKLPQMVQYKYTTHYFCPDIYQIKEGSIFDIHMLDEQDKQNYLISKDRNSLLNTECRELKLFVRQLAKRQMILSKNSKQLGLPFALQFRQHIDNLTQANKQFDGKYQMIINQLKQLKKQNEILSQQAKMSEINLQKSRVKLSYQRQEKNKNTLELLSLEKDLWQEQSKYNQNKRIYTLQQILFVVFSTLAVFLAIIIGFTIKNIYQKKMI